ncbi:DNA polymerase Y family protein [Streptomyces hygroscopicus]|uniref:DNA polymerase Y family protein n=1 Tax=Streptomyces hygroscopicus TaxID=1912 RepID=UPI0037A9FDEB
MHAAAGPAAVEPGGEAEGLGGGAGGGASAGGRGRGRAGGPGQAEDVPHVLYVRFHPTPAEDVYQGLLALLGELTPVVEALPPDAALADVRGALRYFGRDAAGLAEIVRVRALARYGVDCTIGVAANPMLARMAAQEAREAQATQATQEAQGPQEAQEVQGAQEADAPGPGGGRSRRPAGSVRTVPGDPDGVAAFLARKPPTALPGVGPATARTLSAYGLDSAARIAAAPLSTLQRILGAATARRVHAWAHGIDPMPVTPNAPARAMGAEHRFRHDELDPVRRRRALLTLADGLGGRLRTSGQVAAAISLTVRYADRSTTTRSRTLTEPTAHTPALTAAAYALHDALGLQRARVRSVALRVEGLMDAELAPHQLTFDPADEKSRRLEAAADRARARFGASAVRPAGFLDVA